MRLKRKRRRRHFERSVYAGVVVHPDSAIRLDDKLAEAPEAVRISEVDLKLVIEALLVAVLPGAAGRRAGDSRTNACEDIGLSPKFHTPFLYD